MGCDIHLFGEKKVKDSWWKFWEKPKWKSIDIWTPNEDYPEDSEREFTVEREDRIYTDGRNYNVFAALCGVRSESFNGSPPMISEPKGLPDDCCKEIRLESEAWNGDGHSHSWNTLRELKDFDWSEWGKTCDTFKEQVFKRLSIESVSDDDVRIVYWFDN